MVSVLETNDVTDDEDAKRRREQGAQTSSLSVGCNPDVRAVVCGHPLSLRQLEPIFSQHLVPGEVMLGLKRFSSAAITLAGIELMHRIRKGEFNLAGLRLKDTTAPAVWSVVLSVR
jgi:hypothetical protein